MTAVGLWVVCAAPGAAVAQDAGAQAPPAVEPAPTTQAAPEVAPPPAPGVAPTPAPSIAPEASPMASPASLADDTPEAAEAHRLAEEARTAFQEQRYEAAVDALHAAFKLHPDPAYRYNLGRCFQEMGNLPAALDHFREYVRLAPQAENFNEVVNLVAVLEAYLEQQEATRDASVAREGESEDARRLREMEARSAEAEGAARLAAAEQRVKEAEARIEEQRGRIEALEGRVQQQEVEARQAREAEERRAADEEKRRQEEEAARVEAIEKMRRERQAAEEAAVTDGVARHLRVEAGVGWSLPAGQVADSGMKGGVVPRLLVGWHLSAPFEAGFEAAWESLPFESATVPTNQVLFLSPYFRFHLLSGWFKPTVMVAATWFDYWYGDTPWGFTLGVGANMRVLGGFRLVPSIRWRQAWRSGFADPKWIQADIGLAYTF
jgi:tetratricopeptide (TPR) repeat protein